MIKPTLGPSTYTCRTCNQVIQIRHNDPPFLNTQDTRLLCEHMRHDIQRIEGLRQGTPA